MFAWLLPILLAVTPSGRASNPIPPDAPRLLRVAARTLYVDPRAEDESLPAPRLARFAGDPVPARVIFEVLWTPGRAGLAGGARVALDYELDHGRVCGVREVVEPGPVTGPRRTRISIPVEGRPITAWRVRVLEGNRLLLEQRSRNWGR